MQTKTPAAIFHEDIQATVPADLDARLYDILCQHTGKANRITRRALWEAVAGCPAPDRFTSGTLDRQIREAVARLQQTYPILASSGEGGYFMAGSPDEAAAYVSEIMSRATKLLDKARQIEAAAVHEFSRPGQLRLPGI